MSPTNRRRFLRPWLILPLVAVLGVGAWFAFRPSKDAAQAATAPVEQTVEVTTGTMAQTVSASGTIQPTDTEDLAFAVAGTVTAVNVEAGQQVAKGAVLASIDSAELTSAVASAQATVDAAQAKLDDDEDADASDAQITADTTALASANADLASAQDDLAGASLVAPIAGTVSAVDLTVGQQLGSGGTSGTGITGTGTGSGRTSSDLGSASTGAAGAGGTGTGASTTSGTITVISTSSYTIPLSIDATEIAHLKVGQKATVTPTTSAGTTGNGGFGRNGGGFPGGGAFPGGAVPGGAVQTATPSNSGSGSASGATTTTTTPVAAADAVTGTVTSVSAIASASSGVATFPVEVTVICDTSAFHAGATAQVQVIYQQLTDVVQVRSQAITTTDTGATVVVEADGKRETRSVTTGITANGMTQITSGLKAGESVVITLPNFGGRGTQANGGGTPGAPGGAPAIVRGQGG